MRVRNAHIALEGGNRAFADFQVTPPFGRSMLGADTPSGAQVWDSAVVAVVEALYAVSEGNPWAARQIRRSFARQSL